jgi:hypothetical protein
MGTLSTNKAESLNRHIDAGKEGGDFFFLTQAKRNDKEAESKQRANKQISNNGKLIKTS